MVMEELVHLSIEVKGELGADVRLLADKEKGEGYAQVISRGEGTNWGAIAAIALCCEHLTDSPNVLAMLEEMGALARVHMMKEMKENGKLITEESDDFPF